MKGGGKTCKMLVTGNSRVNKHPRLDKIAVKGFSPEMSSFVPYLSTFENPSMANARFSDKSKMAAIQHRLLDLCITFETDDVHSQINVVQPPYIFRHSFTRL